VAVEKFAVGQEYSDSASDCVLAAQDFGPKAQMKPVALIEDNYINPKSYACQLYQSVAAI
jgi:hypothetical protein